VQLLRKSRSREAYRKRLGFHGSFDVIVLTRIDWLTRSIADLASSVRTLEEGRGAVGDQVAGRHQSALVSSSLPEPVLAFPGPS
jgi:hypothetical protein